MTKKPNSKKVFAEFSRIGHPSRAEGSERPDGSLTKKLANKVYQCLARAFEAAGRDIDREEDWKFVTMWLAVSVFAGRDVGHPLKWNRKRMLRLIGDVEKTKADRRAKGLSESDLECCRELLKQAPYIKFKGNKYKNYTASALRRRLGEARRAKRALAAVEASQV